MVTLGDQFDQFWWPSDPHLCQDIAPFHPLPRKVPLCLFSVCVRFFGGGFFWHGGGVFSSAFPFFFPWRFHFLHNLYTLCGARTHNPEIKRPVFDWWSQPGASAFPLNTRTVQYFLWLAYQKGLFPVCMLCVLLWLLVVCSKDPLQRAWEGVLFVGTHGVWWGDGNRTEMQECKLAGQSSKNPALEGGSWQLWEPRLHLSLQLHPAGLGLAL